jgi:hypothetical protein
MQGTGGSEGTSMTGSGRLEGGYLDLKLRADSLQLALRDQTIVAAVPVWSAEGRKSCPRLFVQGMPPNVACHQSTELFQSYLTIAHDGIQGVDLLLASPILPGLEAER